MPAGRGSQERELADEMRIVAAPLPSSAGSGRERRKARRFSAIPPGESGMGQGVATTASSAWLREAS